jgi:hypothetical protein
VADRAFAEANTSRLALLRAQSGLVVLEWLAYPIRHEGLNVI